MKRITFIGVEGSGKTVLTAALADTFGTPSPGGLNLIPENQAAFSFTTLIPHKMKVEHQWPAATSITSMKHLEWTLRLGTDTLLTLSMLDYPGELYRTAFGDRTEEEIEPHREQVHEFLEHLVTSDTLVVLLNLEDAMTMGANARNNETVWLTRSIFDYAQKLPNIKKQLLLFTQADRYADEISGPDGLTNAKAKYLPMLHALYPNIECASVSVATDEQDAPGHDFSATIGISGLLRWIMLQTEIGLTTNTQISDLETYFEKIALEENSLVHFDVRSKQLSGVSPDLCEILNPGLVQKLQQNIPDLRKRVEENEKAKQAKEEQQAREHSNAVKKKRIDQAVIDLKKFTKTFSGVNSLEKLNEQISDYNQKIKFLLDNGVAGLDPHIENLKQFQHLYRLERALIQNNSKFALGKKSTWESISKYFTDAIFLDQIATMHARYRTAWVLRVQKSVIWTVSILGLLSLMIGFSIQDRRRVEAHRVAVQQKAEAERTAAAKKAEAERVFQKRREALYQQAQNGDLESQFQYGRQLWKEENRTGARHWWLQAAEQGHLGAQLKMAEITRWNDQLHWYRLAAEQGSAEAKMAIVRIQAFSNYPYGFMQSSGAAKIEEARKWLGLAAAQNVAEAQYWIGVDVERQSNRNYNRAHEIEKINEAIEWYQKAARQDHRQAQSALQRLGHAW